MKKIGIVIVNYRGRQNTLECLDSLVNQEYYPIEIIVVDNNSNDESVKHIKKKFPKVQIIANKKNLGFAKANNLGIKKLLKTGCSYIFLLNNDTVIVKDCLSYLIDTIKLNHQIGALSPKIYFCKGFEFYKKRYKEEEKGRVIWYAGGRFNWENLLASHVGVDEVDRGQYDTFTATDFATGCAMLVPAEVFKKVGVFDERYFLYYEDLDLCEKIRRKGYIIGFEPKAVVWHKNAASSGSGSALHDYYIVRNRFLFGFKYGSLRTKLRLLKESLHFMFKGRKWQKRAVRDFYLGNLGKGSFSV